MARVRRYEPGDTLYRVQDPANGVYGLASGALDILIPRVDGEEVKIHRADVGFWVGDLALFSGQKRQVSIYAAAPSLLVHLPQRPLMASIEAHPEVIWEFYRLAYQTMTLTLNLLGNLTITPSEIRIALRLLQQESSKSQVDDWIQISQTTLSELVALSPPTMQRALRKLEQGGLIETGYGRIRISDRPGLLRMCNDVAREALTA